jgi:hypothetical protein
MASEGGVDGDVGRRVVVGSGESSLEAGAMSASGIREGGAKQQQNLMLETGRCGALRGGGERVDSRGKLTRSCLGGPLRRTRK